MEKYKGKKRLIPYLIKYWQWSVLATIMSFFLTFSNIAMNFSLKKIMDISFEDLDKIVILYCIMLVMGMLSRYFFIYGTGKFSLCILKDIKNDVINHITKLPFSFIRENKIGDVIAKLSNDTDYLQKYLEAYLADAIYIPIMLLGFSAYLLYMDAPLFFLCTCCYIVLLPISFCTMKPIKERSREYVKKLGDTNNSIQDMIDGMEVVKAYCIEQQLKKKYMEKLYTVFYIAYKNDKRQYAVEPVSELICNLPLVICLIEGGREVIAGKMTMGTLLVFINILKLMIEPLMRAYLLYINSKMAVVCLERTLSFFDMAPEESKEMIELIPESDTFSLSKIYFSYGEKKVLNNISFQVKKNERVALVGQSGCGKSTLLSLLCRINDEYSGDIKFYGKDIREIDSFFYREQIAYVSQDSYLFPVTVMENIQIGDIHASREDVIRVAKLALAHDFILELEDGYETVISENGSSLSGGQKQRISIARALLKKADILILDEPTSALDMETEQKIIENLDNVRDKTIIFITHRSAPLAIAEQVIYLNQGNIV